MSNKIKNYNKQLVAEKKEDFYFEVLVADTIGDVVVKSEEDLCYNLLSNSELWSDSEFDKSKLEIIDKIKGIRVQVKKTETPSNDSETTLKQSYTVSANSYVFSSIESFRIPLLVHLKDLKFNSIYILEDQISMTISKGIYPSIARVESFLRKYIIKFFVTKIGPEWWKLTADSEMQKKTGLRKNNETVFSEYIDNEVYLIDFGELGKLIYAQSSGNLNKDDIVAKILKLDDTVESLQKFKQEIQTNYNKFFKSTFKENNFQNDWEELEKIRHKVAHNNLFVLSDQHRCKELVSRLINTIDTANKEINKISFSNTDKIYIMESIVEFKPIEKDVFMDELKYSENWAEEVADGFVGLQNFLSNILGSKGYEYEAARTVLRELEAEGLIETYSYESTKNEHPVAALRIKKL